LNACEVGRPSPELVGVGGFAATFIGLGAGCVVAALWSVKDTVAHELATAFYDHLREYPDTSLAEILRKLRGRSYDEENTAPEDTWAAYCFYGDPTAKVVLS
jgi:CHAT domain-containing protein